MASQTSALPDGSTLTKPAYTDSADIAVINTNMDKIVSNINAENQALSNQNPKRGALSASQIVNDTSIMDFEPGTYQNALGNSIMPYLPTGYGTLDVADSGVAYKAFIYTSTANDIYYRICHKTESSWYGGWQQLALKSNISRTLLGSLANPSGNASVDLTDSVNNYNYIQIFFQKSGTTGAFISQIIHADNVSIGSYDSISFSAYNNASYNFYAEGGFGTATRFNIATYRSTGWTMSRVYVVGIGKK